jgi:hypothetical protein
MMHRFHRQGTGALKSGTTSLITLVACALSAGCGNITAGGLVGEAAVVVSGDAPDPQGVSAQSATNGRLASTFTNFPNEPEGQVEADFFIFLLASDGNRSSLSDDEIQIRLDVRGQQEADVARRTVPATQYTPFQVVFTAIKVEVEAGLVINGVPVVGEVRVELKDSTLTVTRPLDLEIAEGAVVELLLDLNANTWLEGVDPVLGTISEETFADALSVAVR